MFTGIVSHKSPVQSFEKIGTEGARVRIATRYPDLEIGESVCVNGVCLTATEVTPSGDTLFFIGSETLRKTNLGELAANRSVNLERSLLANTRLSGHWVQGHVDGLATVEEIADEGGTFRVVFSMSRELVRYCVEKGSITLNGVSLTLNSVIDEPKPLVIVHLIPHTWNETNLSELKLGDTVNVEIDILSKYVERLCLPYRAR